MDARPSPDRVNSPPAFVDRLLAFLEVIGRSVDDDECVTQLDHARQTAALASTAGADEAAQVAALLHDVGHLLMDAGASAAPAIPSGLRHEEVGARLLASWFGEDVAGPVRLHVAAKRALVTVDPGYAGVLSGPSTRSLDVQGGPMTTAELAAFEASPHAARAVDLRRWDDRAKDPAAVVPPLETWRPVLLHCVERHRATR